MIHDENNGKMGSFIMDDIDGAYSDDIIAEIFISHQPSQSPEVIPHKTHGSIGKFNTSSRQIF